MSSSTCTVSSSLMELSCENRLTLSVLTFEKNNKRSYFHRHKKVTKISGPTFYISLVERSLTAKKLPTVLLYYHSKIQGPTTNSFGATGPFGWKSKIGPKFCNLWRSFSKPCGTNFKNPSHSFNHILQAFQRAIDQRAATTLRKVSLRFQPSKLILENFDFSTILRARLSHPEQHYSIRSQLMQFSSTHINSMPKLIALPKLLRSS